MPINLPQSHPYWKLEVFFKRLHLSYREKERRSGKLHFLLMDFGTVVVLDEKIIAAQQYKDWDVVNISTEELEKNEGPVLEELFWHLIEKGYFAFARGNESSPSVSSKLFRSLIIDEGWGTKIMNRRLSFWANRPKYKFLIERNRRALKLPVHFLLMHYPDFFDHLY